MSPPFPYTDHFRAAQCPLFRALQSDLVLIEVGETFNRRVENSNPSVLLVDSGLVECADGGHGVRPFWRHRNADLGSGFRAREHYLGVVIESIGVGADTGAPTVPNYALLRSRATLKALPHRSDVAVCLFREVAVFSLLGQASC